jgi:ABC-2 type transport system permease protein
MTVVFGKLLNNNVENYSAYLLAAYLPFSFFQTSVLDSAQSVLGSVHLVKKIYFPREFLPLASVLSNFIHLLLGYVVFFALLLVTYLVHPGVIPFRATTIYLPVLLLISLTLSIGLSFLVSALNTFYEDVKYVVGVIMYLMLFLCPVMYFIETIAYSARVRAHPIWFKLYSLNPVADLSIAYRKILLAPASIEVAGPVKGTTILATPLPLQWNWIGYSALFSLATLVLGYTVFNRLKSRFVERF